MTEDDPPKPVLSPLFWTALALALACIVAGVAVGFYGPVLFPARPPHAQTLGKPPSHR